VQVPSGEQAVGRAELGFRNNYLARGRGARAKDRETGSHAYIQGKKYFDDTTTRRDWVGGSGREEVTGSNRWQLKPEGRGGRSGVVGLPIRKS
jgi:hypothetical protein